MESLLLKNGFTKMSSNYYHHESIGPILAIDNCFIKFDPISSFENSIVINAFFDNLLEHFKHNHKNFILIFDKSSLSENEKKLFPDVKVSIVDASKEKAFVDFFTENNEIINSKPNCEKLIPYYNFEIDSYAIGYSNFDKNGTVSLEHVYDNKDVFSLNELQKHFDSTVFNEVTYLEMPGEVSFYTQMSNHFNNAKKGEFYYRVSLVHKEKLALEFTFYNYDAIDSIVSEEYYDEDEDKEVYENTIYAYPSGNSFVFAPTDVQMIKNEIKKLKVKNLFKV